MGRFSLRFIHHIDPTLIFVVLLVRDGTSQHSSASTRLSVTVLQIARTSTVLPDRPQNRYKELNSIPASWDIAAFKPRRGNALVGSFELTHAIDLFAMQQLFDMTFRKVGIVKWAPCSS